VDRGVAKPSIDVLLTGQVRSRVEPADDSQGSWCGWDSFSEGLCAISGMLSHRSSPPNAFPLANQDPQRISCDAPSVAMLQLFILRCFGEFCEEPVVSECSYQLEKELGPFIKRPVNARCSFDRIRPTFTETVSQSLGDAGRRPRLVVSQGGYGSHCFKIAGTSQVGRFLASSL